MKDRSNEKIQGEEGQTANRGNVEEGWKRNWKGSGRYGEMEGRDGAYLALTSD